jgi:hypothetical protein
MDNAAIIVKINSVEKHPNADKLQIVKLFGTQIVVGLDTKPGDVLVYVDSNMKMSQDFLSENNLFRHCELNADKKSVGFFEDHGRVKCIKLRGEVSDGFLFPLSHFEYIGVNVPQETAIGYEFNSVNGILVCEKYVPISPTGGPHDRNSKPLSKKIEIPMFKEHFDTSQFMKNQHVIPAGTICYLEEKIHGTSHRTGLVQYPMYDELPWWKRVLFSLLKTKNATEWRYINGTRRVIHMPNKKCNSYHENTMREEVLEKVRGMLFKGEEIYLELFGHEKSGAHIQKNFPYNTRHGVDGKSPYRILLYRVTMNNEDGVTVDYNREAVYTKAEELGFEKPHLFEKYYYDGSEESLKTLEQKMIEYAQGKSAMGLLPGQTSDTLREGVVCWFINSSGKWQALKYKSDAFRLAESGLKDNGIIDQEDIN